MTCAIDTIKVTSMYLPPSIALADVGSALEVAARSNIVLADVNVKYNNVTGTGNPAKRAMLLDN